MIEDFAGRLKLMKEDYSEYSKSGQDNYLQKVWVSMMKIIRDINLPDDELIYAIIDEVFSYLRGEMKLCGVSFLNLTEN